MPTLKRKLSWPAMLVAALVSSLVGRPAAAEDCSELGIGELGFALVEHSCFHSTNGPFADVVATPGAVAGNGTANVDPVHTHYAVAVVPGQQNVVVYTPARSGTWAIFTETAMALTVVEPGGQALPVRLTHPIAGCSGLPLVRVYTLTAGRRYTLQLGPPAPGVTVTPLVLEKVSDFETLHGKDGDGDGFGGLAETLATPCVPPAGYVASVSDCDDEDPAVHPGAAEVCNGRDDDCDAQGDEEACQLGGGGCRAVAPGAAAPAGAASSTSPLWLLAPLGVLWALRRRRRTGGGAAVALVLGALCHDGAAEAAPSCSRLAEPITDHSCFHTRFGPFREVTAGGFADNLDEVHTYYAVKLPAPSRRDGLSYRPARSGRWAFYVQHDVPLEVRDGGGAALPVVHADVVPGCPLLARVSVVELTAGAVYQVILGPTTASEVGVVIENLDDFVVILGRDRDGDGHGSANELESSPCLPEAGWVVGDADCDDGDPQVYPGAPELCGGPDRNCNGVAGDIGEPCQLGVGTCAGRGVFTCAAPGAAPACQAVAGAPGSERCDGLDADCDGSSDLVEPALCVDVDEPRCVADGRGGARCGCERDADCGGPDSGRLCWLSGVEQRCIEGCVTGFERNGCAAGLRCTSADPAAPGSCVPDQGGGQGGCRAGGGSGVGLLLILAAIPAWAGRRRRRTR
jgi:Putative metal-binding motif